MGMVINHNIPALISYNAVNHTMGALQKSIQKLSTGLRINSAADDAAGLAISEKMRAQTRGLDQAVRNSQDGISMIQTAEGSLNETQSILQRMRELSVQAANDTLTQQDRGYIQLEIDQLREEITRIGDTTQFNKKKLLDGSAAVLWSSDKLETKALINGGLRQVDQFGQKAPVEGNYNLAIRATAGQGEIQKSDLFKIKHKNVITDVQVNDQVITRDIRVNDLPKLQGANSEFSLRYEATGIASLSANPGAYVVDFYGRLTAGTVENYISAAAGTITGAGSILMEFKDVVTAAGAQRATVKVSVEMLSANGGNYAFSREVSVTTAGGVQVFEDGTGLAGITVNLSAEADMTGKIQNGDKVVYQYNGETNFSAGVMVNYSSTTTVAQDAQGKVTAAFVINSKGLSGRTITFKNFYLDGNTGEASLGSFTLSFRNKGDIKESVALANFKTTQIGDVAKSDIKLRDLDKFWDSQGRFMLTDPQTINITQGDGKTAKVTLYAYDTLGDVADKLNYAIGEKLGQSKYVERQTGKKVDPRNFASFVDDAKGNIESVEGTFILRSVIPGSAGKLSLAGDEDLIKAFSLNTIQDAKDSTYSVTISDAHSNETLSSAEITGNRLIGVVNPNVDVEFDAMAGISATWNDDTKTYVYNAKDYSTVLHLSDNTTVFQIGANEGEDMGINIGDMRSHALGLNEVLVTDRESAARSITVIDNAIDKVSTQRAKLGAYQNRLEHTISNLTVAGENLTAAESRIRDTDMAKQMMEFTKLNIMLQAGNSMLAQANQLPNGILGLLR